MNGKDSSIAQDFDPDTAPDLSKDGWPEKFSKTAVRRGRSLSENPKVSTTIRLSQDVIDHFRAGVARLDQSSRCSVTGNPAKNFLLTENTAHWASSRMPSKMIYVQVVVSEF